MIKIDIRDKPVTRREIAKARRAPYSGILGWYILSLLGIILFGYGVFALIGKFYLAMLPSINRELLVVLMATGFLLLALTYFMDTEYKRCPLRAIADPFHEVNHELASVMTSDLMDIPEIREYCNLVVKQRRNFIRAELKEMHIFHGYKSHQLLSQYEGTYIQAAGR